MAPLKRSRSLNSDKALPLLPSVTSSPPSSGAETLSSSFVDAMNCRLSDCTTWSTPYVDKQTFKKLTQELVAPPTPSPSFKEREAYNCVDPIKPFSTGSNIRGVEMIDQNTSFRDLRSPYQGDYGHTPLEGIYDSRDREFWAKAAHNMYGSAATTSPQRSPGISQSVSDSNMRYQNGYSSDRKAPAESSNTLQGFPYIRFADETDPPLVQSTPRGRATNRTPSPAKHLEDIKEESPSNPYVQPRRSRSPVKQLFGENGWLGRSTSMKELPSEEYRKTGFKVWGGKLKQRMLEKTEDISKIIPAALNVHPSPSKPPKIPHTSKFPITLIPPEQARLYSEIELMICAAANDFLLKEKEAGRMSYESVVKITQFWASKNRPQVVDFRFDQATQRDLVEYNVKNFKFNGPSAGSPMAVHAMLLAWKHLAKEMSVRTFCSPDSMIKKHMQDCYKILEMLGAPMITFLAYQQIHVTALRKMNERQASHKDSGSKKAGVEVPWEPPGGWSPKKDSGDGWGHPYDREA